MPYTIIFRDKAKKEYIQSIAWYQDRSLQAAENFVAQIQILLSKIEKQPDFYRQTYK